MGSVMSLSCSKRKATSPDVESESRKRRKICSTNDDDENCRVIPSPSLPSPPSSLSLPSPPTSLSLPSPPSPLSLPSPPTSLSLSSPPSPLSLPSPPSPLSLPSPPTSLSLPSPPTPLSLPSPPSSLSLSTLLSLPSPPPYLSQIWKHDVFPSFHGADVRKTIHSHILESFRRKGIDTFVDNEIERSKSIGPELVEAIKGSKIAIVLLSKNYASSSWCLDELAEIMKCREERGQIVMTIFCEVEPTDIKKQTGDFGKAFIKTCEGKTKERTERWRKALEDVATIAGEHNWENEATMIKKVATDVLNILNISTPSRDFDSLVGMGTHMGITKRLLRLDLDKEVRMIGIWGPPGIGKTTIARVLFNQISSGFQLSANMKNIKGYYPRPCLDEHNAQVQLQNQMLSQLLNQKDINISSLRVAPERLKGKKVLLVLDDVDELGQLDALAEKVQWFGPGSRIIITTEDRRVLDAYRINHIYKVKFPSSDEAFQIFCMHAFGQKHPDDGFFDLAWEVTKLAGDLPLGLKILGSALKGMSKQEWEGKLPILKTSLNKNIGSIIKFSYDALDDEDKYLFLYIACLFTSEYSDNVEEILAKKVSSVGQRLHILAQKSLISIHDFGRIDMHTLLQKFGRETSKKEFVHHGYAKRQLLVGAKDICEVLSDDTTDCRRFIGINLDLSETEEELNISEKALERLHDFQFVRINGNDIAHPKRLDSLLCYSQHIRSLHWKNFQNIYLPSNFNPEFLVELNLGGSKLEKLWEGSKPLRNLKWMDLSYSRYLKELPDLSTATKLEELNLSYCYSLVELPSTIGNAINLQRLYLPSSIWNAEVIVGTFLRLVTIPSFIENATNLRVLDLSGCVDLVELPSIWNAPNLQKLDLKDCWSLVKLPSSINAPNLRRLYLQNCYLVVKLFSIENATNLRILDLQNCSSLQELPPSIGTATNLEKLVISGCSSLVKLPSSIGDLINLRCFDLSHCSSLQELHPSIGTATNLQDLKISGCSSLMKLPSSIGDLTNLKEFDLSNCSSLVELPSSIGNLQQLYDLIMGGCSKLEALPTNINLESLNRLDLTDCSQLKTFPEISTNIEELSLIGTAIKEVPLSIMSWSCLSDFKMAYFESLTEFPHAFNIITELHLVNEDIREIPPWVKGMSCLHELRLYNCNNLVSLPQLPDSLCYLLAENCKSLERLDCSFEYPNLEFVNCLKLNQETKDLILQRSTEYDAMLSGTEVPDCFNHRATGCSLTIKLNESPLPTSFRFKACIMLVYEEELVVEEELVDDENLMSVHVDIMENGKDFGFQRRSTSTEQLLWTFEVEAEQVTSTELVFEFTTEDDSKWKIGECGLLQILEVPS